MSQPRAIIGPLPAPAVHRDRPPSPRLCHTATRVCMQALVGAPCGSRAPSRLRRSRAPPGGTAQAAAAAAAAAASAAAAAGEPDVPHGGSLELDYSRGRLAHARRRWFRDNVEPAPASPRVQHLPGPDCSDATILPRLRSILRILWAGGRGAAAGGRTVGRGGTLPDRIAAARDRRSATNPGAPRRCDVHRGGVSDQQHREARRGA